MKKIVSLSLSALFLMGALAFSACSDDDGPTKRFELIDNHLNFPAVSPVTDSYLTVDVLTNMDDWDVTITEGSDFMTIDVDKAAKTVKVRMLGDNIGANAQKQIGKITGTASNGIISTVEVIQHPVPQMPANPTVFDLEGEYILYGTPVHFHGYEGKELEDFPSSWPATLEVTSEKDKELKLSSFGGYSINRLMTLRQTNATTLEISQGYAGTVYPSLILGALPVEYSVTQDPNGNDIVKYPLGALNGSLNISTATVTFSSKSSFAGIMTLILDEDDLFYYIENGKLYMRVGDLVTPLYEDLKMVMSAKKGE